MGLGSQVLADWPKGCREGQPDPYSLSHQCPQKHRALPGTFLCSQDKRKEAEKPRGHPHGEGLSRGVAGEEEAHGPGCPSELDPKAVS